MAKETVTAKENGGKGSRIKEMQDLAFNALMQRDEVHQRYVELLQKHLMLMKKHCALHDKCIALQDELIGLYQRLKKE